MNDEILERLISNLLKGGIEPPRMMLRHLSDEQNEVFQYHSTLDKALLGELIDYLRSDALACLIFDNKTFNTGNGGSLVTIENLATWLAITSHRVGVRNTIAQLHAFLNVERTPALAILAVSGIESKEEIAISDSIKLVPFESLPPSIPKDALAPPFLKDEFLIRHGFIPFHNHVSGGFPKAALVKRIELFPKSYGDNVKKFTSVDYSDLYEACEFLTLFKKSTPVPSGAWTEVDPIVPCKQLLGSSWSYQLPDVISNTDTIISALDWIEIRAIYENFSKMDRHDKDLLRIPIQRLNQARRRKNIADKAIDQGIAFEALFINDEPEKDQLSFKLRLRASLLLGSNVEMKREIFNLIKAFYDCRSSAVHTGKSKLSVKIQNRGKVDAEDVLNESDTICRSSILKIIDQGGFPNWTNLMLG